MKMDYSEKLNLKELSYALEGLENKNIDDNIKLSTHKFVEYILKFNKSKIETYKVIKDNIIEKDKDKIDTNEIILLENKISKLKIKNKEIKEQMKVLNNKLIDFEEIYNKKDKTICELNKKISSYIKENIDMSNKLKNKKSKENIPFKKIDELQSLKQTC